MTITVRLSGGTKADIIWRPRAATLQNEQQRLRQECARRVIDPETGYIDHTSDAPLTWDEVVDLFCQRKFGEGAFFFQDHGLPKGYGQVFRPLPRELGGGNSAKTGKTLIEVFGLEED